ncbi:MAG TPA: type III pantothenate kinase [Pyrinomonadaceae bacterium]|jgi:type III pantothenate kinase
MLLAIDIGNSTTKFGVFDNDRLIKRFFIPTLRRQAASETNDLIQNDLNYPFSAAIASSVVPEANDAFEKFCDEHFNLKLVFVDSTLDFGLKILYNPPQNLGIDRAVAAFAAREKYGKPVIVCDFGTATTIDVVNAAGEFAGGIITPGIKTLADSLFEKTSRLPRVEIKKPESVIGATTVGAIQSGIYFGYVGLVEGILRKMLEELNAKPVIVATGGFVSLIAEDVKMIDVVDENLMLEGLRLIYEKIRN